MKNLKQSKIPQNKIEKRANFFNFKKKSNFKHNSITTPIVFSAYSNNPLQNLPNIQHFRANLNSQRTIFRGTIDFYHNPKSFLSANWNLETKFQRFLNSKMEQKEHLNRLAKEKSPYLLQHKHNPVDWYPWGEEAFQEAKKQNKMIFLSIGYSTCHWCHVMAHESFENPEIAKVMNNYFINIKVDREERPDVDKLYMTFLQATTGGGGWPASIFLTPDLEPVFAGTYFAPTRKYGQIGFLELLELLHKEWKSDPEDLKARGKRIISAIRASLEEQYSKSQGKDLSDEFLDTCFRQIQSGYDQVEGGFTSAPKFPRPVIFDFLFRFIFRSGINSNVGKTAMAMNLFTLRKMAMGGMYDQIGGGFHRYSVTKDWHVPHFEKMLYDNAQLVSTYVMAYQLTKDSFYEEKVRDILQYIMTKMTHPEGGIYSAEDADSIIEHGKPEHAEGAFYVWKMSEINQLLGEENSKIFNFHFGVEPNGNCPPGGDPHNEFKGKNILIQRHTVQETAKHFNLPEEKIQEILKNSRQILYDAREKRPRPHLDDKIITAWNGLMLSGFSKAFQVLGNKKYLNAAISAANFIYKYLYVETDGILIRNFREGPSNIPGFTDDYSFLIQGLIDLYEATFNLHWLKWAIRLQDKQNELFWDSKNSAYFNVQVGDKSLLLRMKEDYDGAEPSNNSVSALNLLRLAILCGNNSYRDYAEKIFLSFQSVLKERPIVAPLLCLALDFYLHSPAVLVIVGSFEDPNTQAMLKKIHQTFLPNKVLILLNSETSQFFQTEKLEYLRDMKQINNTTTIYVCENFTCQLPTNSISELENLLKKSGAIFQAIN